ncbi:hypothetical protein RCOM_1714550 [Ricinus communis]|uniref:Uncharacterized protein n=1 Tax=Ricinus communis TaxID=3988 RepID=B9SJU7_RICCO|nr:hypothetical protein RCOM_1714550 [Ricinus communis]
MSLVNNLISIGLGCEAAFSAAILGDNALMEKAWQDTGMLVESVLHAQAHGRPTLKNLVQAWNKMLQKEVEHSPSTKTDAATAFLASLEEPMLTSLAEAGKKPPIEILPPGMPSLSAFITSQKKPTPATQSSQQQPSQPLQIEGPPPANFETTTESTPITATETAPENTPQSSAPENAPQSSAPELETASPPLEASESNGSVDTTPISTSGSNPDLATSGDNIPPTSTDSITSTQIQPQIPNNQGTKISSMMPLGDDFI